VLDELEIAVARWVVERRLPTLGICRGQQLLNVALGGSLVQDLPSEGVDTHRQQAPRHGLAHAFSVEPESRLARIFGETQFQVNSFHHQAVRAVAPSLRAVAWAPDGTIEALESAEHPWLLAVQFHPEDLVGFHQPSQRLLSALVEASSSAATES
jgi:putative glutamine amidotransferase